MDSFSRKALLPITSHSLSEKRAQNEKNGKEMLCNLKDAMIIDISKESPLLFPLHENQIGGNTKSLTCQALIMHSSSILSRALVKEVNRMVENKGKCHLWFKHSIRCHGGRRKSLTATLTNILSIKPIVT